jgi:hypothetical protein
MRTGALIDYRLSLLGLPVPWRTRIEEWHPGHGFTDRQLHGPYARWVHRHRFVPADGGTWLRDEVECAAAGAIDGPRPVRAPAPPSDLRLPARRDHTVAGMSASIPPSTAHVPSGGSAGRTVLLTGATGYVGGRLLPALEARGLRVRCLARRPEYLAGRIGPGTEIAAGDIRDGHALARALEGVDRPTTSCRDRVGL